MPSSCTLKPTAGRLAVLRIGQCNVGKVNRGFLGHDACFLRLGLLLVAANHVDAADQGLVVSRQHLDDFAGLTLVTAGQHNHRVAFFNFRSHQSTSGASEMIFIWFFCTEFTRYRSEDTGCRSAPCCC